MSPPLPPANAQRLLIGSWRATLDQSAVTLVIITAEGDGWLQGILRYDTPRADGFAGAPFTTQIQNGGFSFGLDNNTSFRDIHWCGDALCGTYFAPDDTPIPFRSFRGREVHCRLPDEMVSA